MHAEPCAPMPSRFSTRPHHGTAASSTAAGTASAAAHEVAAAATGAAAAAAGDAPARDGSLRRCQEYLDWDVDQAFSVVLTADPGDFSGVSEAHYILANLRDRRDKPRDGTVCGGHSTGVLMGQPMLVVTTGACQNRHMYM